MFFGELIARCDALAELINFDAELVDQFVLRLLNESENIPIHSMISVNQVFRCHFLNAKH